MPTDSAAEREDEAAEPTRGGGWYVVVLALCLAFLAFVAGAFVMHHDGAVADPLRRAFLAAHALHDRLRIDDEPFPSAFWKPARSEARGVVRHDPARAQQGLTLYTSGHEQAAYLIDMDGRVVHEWRLPYSAVWRAGGPIRQPRPDRFVFLEKAYVFPNGDLLALYTAYGDAPWGYGLIKADKDSNVIWRYLDHAHHDFDLDDAGNIYVLTHEISEEELPGGFSKHLRTPRIDDFIVKLSPDGEPLDKFWITGAFSESPQGRRFYFVPWHVHASLGDYTHANSVHVLRRPLPGVPQSRPGQLLVSLREVSALVLADLESASVPWALSGPWVRQHDAQVLPNGRILLFDNEGDPSGHGVSRVLEFHPATYEVAWSYVGGEGEPLDSVERSSQSRLANGNTLVVDSMSGRLIEVTPDGDVVWEFVNPVRGGEDDELVPIIFWVQRLDPEADFTPEFRRRLGR